MSIKVLVVERIKELCRMRGITINTLANISGLTPSTIYSLLDPKRKDIGIVTIKKICDGLDMNIVDFFNTIKFYECDQEIK